MNGEAWELYHVAEDHSELNDLAAEKPAVRDSLVRAYEAATAGAKIGGYAPDPAP